MRLNRLVLEFDSDDRRSVYYYILFSNVKSEIMRELIRYKKDHDYPLDINLVISMCKLEFTPTKVYIGYRLDSYKKDNEVETFKKLLELEYGYNGREIRIIRKVLEKVV